MDQAETLEDAQRRARNNARDLVAAQDTIQKLTKARDDLRQALHALCQNPHAGEKWFNEFTYGCEFCDALQRDTSEGFTHTPDCLMAQARKVLADTQV